MFESLSADVKRARFHPESYESAAKVQRARESATALERANVQKKFFEVCRNAMCK